MTIISQPVLRSSWPKKPVEYASPINPVAGDLPNTPYLLPDAGTSVPVTGPTENISTFSGPSGSIPGF